MKVRTTLVALATAAAALVVLPGCAVTRGQESVGAFVDDTTITTKIKAKFAEDTRVAATSISVETLNGEVMLSGFAKSYDERSWAESIARNTSGVKAVKNSIVVRS